MLVVVDLDDTNTIKSFLNLPDVQLIETRELNAYDVLCSDYVIFSNATLVAVNGPNAKPTENEGSGCQEGTGDTKAPGDTSTSARPVPQRA